MSDEKKPLLFELWDWIVSLFEPKAEEPEKPEEPEEPEVPEIEEPELPPHEDGRELPRRRGSITK